MGFNGSYPTNIKKQLFYGQHMYCMFKDNKMKYQYNRNNQYKIN